MDYNDNEYEGQNLHLAGEETSKISSVLRPFALPKFDFDDSLHGHLRFDTLVENEVFLGIPSQEDNQWIEDFSRGGNGIEFSSSAAESCALPRHINVWSEATSTESVEMLLKAVGQEELVPGENMMEESDPSEQLGSSTKQIENNLRQESKSDDGDCGNPSLPPVEIEGNISSSNQSAVVGGVHTEYAIEVQGTNFSAYGVFVDCKDSSLIPTSGNSNVDTAIAGENHGEACGLLNESLSNLVQESIPALGTEIEINNIESSSQNIAVIVRESVDQDKIDTSFVSSSCIAKGTSDSVEEQAEECNRNDDKLGETASETDNTDRHCFREAVLETESSKEDQAVVVPVTNFGEASSMHEKGESVSTVDGSHDGEFVVETASSSKQETVLFSPGIEINHPSDSSSIYHEKSSVSLPEEGIEGLGTEESDVAALTIYSNTEKKQFPVIESLDQHMSPVINKDISCGGNYSLESTDATFESSVLNVVPSNPENDGQSNNADGPVPVPGNSTGLTSAGECCKDKSLIDDIRDARDTAVIQKENIETENQVHAPLVAGSTQNCSEDITSTQADAHGSELDVSADEKEAKKLHLDSNDISCDDNEKEAGSTFKGEEVGEEVKPGTTPGSELDSSGDYPVSNMEFEVTKLKSSIAEGDDLVDCQEHNPPSFDLKNKDQDKENETEAPKTPTTSLSKESLESNELVPGTDTQKATLPCSAAAETKASDQSVSLVEAVAMPDGACKEFSKKVEHSASDLIVQDDGAEDAPIGEPMQAEAEAERTPGKESSTVSFISCPVETGTSNQSAILGDGADLSQSEINKQASLKRNDIENIGGVLTTSEISEVNVLSKEESSFTFDIRPLGGQSMGETGKGLQSFPRIKACKMSLPGEVSPSPSGSSHTDLMTVKEITHVSSSTPGITTAPSGGPKGPSERKARRGSSKSGKGSANKGNQVKDTTPLRQTENWDKSSKFSSPRAGQVMTFDSIMKTRGPVSVPVSSLPDLNTSASSSAFFQQPFTDLQQVQLRAQIFVYGSLIQGTAPDEACMVSAFDGGRSAWEHSWRACVERSNVQKMQGSNSETPVPSRSGTKVPDQSNKQGVLQNEVLTSMAGRASNKVIPSPVVNPMMSISSPLWSISTPSGEALHPSSITRSAVIDYQAVSPLNPYQTPPVRNYIAQTTWPSQAPYPVPWLATSQGSSFDASTNYPAFPITEPVKLTPVKESSLPITSGMKHVASLPATRAGTTNMFAGGTSHDFEKLKVSTGQTVDRKTRKRKKSSAAEDVLQISTTASVIDTVSAPLVANLLSSKGPGAEDLSHISLIARNQVDLMPKPVVSSHYSTSVAVTTPFSSVPKGTSNQFFTLVSPPISGDHIKRGDLSIDKRAVHIEGFSKVEEARLQAQEAAAHAASAVSHCEGLWSQLNQHKNSGLTSEAESKLASSAAAIAAAASVAKAAAAAAKIASSAAEQAKEMADEALTYSGTINPLDYDAVLFSNSMNVANASPASILKGGDRNSAANLAITAAREAARKRIEAASAATRHAENLDAIVKAAELAAEAVSHAGKIVAMGDPFSLSELAEAGLNNYWKVPQVATVPGSKPNETSKNNPVTSNLGEVPNFHMNQHERPYKDLIGTSGAVPPIRRELSRNRVDDHVTVEENLIAFGKHGESSFKPQKDKKVSESAVTDRIVSGPDVESGSDLFTITSIKEGSCVEVLKDRNDLKKAWFSASVLSLKDDEALVCYTDLQSDDGSDKLKEWISVEAKDGEAPKVRIPHPMTAVQFEGTKKRRRAAVKDYTWSVGDKVDAWVQDCWCEGIIAEKSKKDATTLSVHFPARGETILVKMWHLRPSLIWKDGEWIEWCRPGQDGTNQGDTPMEKRPRLGNLGIEAKGKAKIARNIDFVETGKNEEQRLPLSANEKVFSIGSTKEEIKPNTVRTMRSGLQKEGSRVVFGVPKPGKKRKFMEVSKHYVSDRSTKTNVPNDSVKLANYLMPQGSGSRGLKNYSRLEKGKQVAESRPRALKSEKPPSIPSRSVAGKDESASSRTNARDAAVPDRTVKRSVSNDENEPGEQNIAESGSSYNVNETSGGPIVFSSQAPPQEKRKRTATRNIRSQQPRQAEPAPAAENLNVEAAEPRRSNRRIQPTSRMLEGLQSSLVISKIPSSSHDRGHRSQNRGPIRGNNNQG